MKLLDYARRDTLFRIPAVTRPLALHEQPTERVVAVRKPPMTPWIAEKAIERARLRGMTLPEYLDALVLRDLHSDAQAEYDLYAQVDALARMEAQAKQEVRNS